jgi:16S rRNA (cytidine1402-2'-O)-methyltransferase
LHTGEAIVTGATLYVVATPIGNLRDVTLRALDVLKGVDVVAAEDTRVTRQLLSHYGIATELVAMHQHNEARASARLLERLAQGKSVAMVSDAGTPGVSDPGALLVRGAWEAGFRVVPIPGASAVIAALSAAGRVGPGFVFVGFLPSQRSARRRALEDSASLAWDLVFYESPHRVRETLAEMEHVFGPHRELVIARELTKLFESVHRCSLGEALGWLDADVNRLKGEFVLIVAGDQRARADAAERAGERALHVLLRELPVAQAARLAAQISGARKNDLYQRALTLKAES